MTQERNSAEQLLDLLVYAPVGLAVEMCDRLPELAEKGRERLGPQAPAARLIGEMAVNAGRKKFDEMVGNLKQTDTASQTADPASPTAANDRAAEAPNDRAAAATESNSGAEPFSGYDAMTAVEIISRLADLSNVDRAAVRAYELAEKGRRTILGKIDQLEARDD